MCHLAASVSGPLAAHFLCQPLVHPVMRWYVNVLGVVGLFPWHAFGPGNVYHTKTPCPGISLTSIMHCACFACMKGFSLPIDKRPIFNHGSEAAEVNDRLHYQELFAALPAAREFPKALAPCQQMRPALHLHICWPHPVACSNTLSVQRCLSYRSSSLTPSLTC